MEEAGPIALSGREIRQSFLNLNLCIFESTFLPRLTRKTYTRGRGGYKFKWDIRIEHEEEIHEIFFLGGKFVTRPETAAIIRNLIP